MPENDHCMSSKQGELCFSREPGSPLMPGITCKRLDESLLVGQVVRHHCINILLNGIKTMFASDFLFVPSIFNVPPSTIILDKKDRDIVKLSARFDTRCVEKTQGPSPLSQGCFHYLRTVLR